MRYAIPLALLLVVVASALAYGAGQHAPFEAPGAGAELPTPTATPPPDAWDDSIDSADFPRAGHVSVTTTSGVVIVFGGATAPPPNGEVPPPEAYFPTTGWFTLPAPTVLDVIRTATAIANDRVLVTGTVFGAEQTELAEVFDFNMKTWSSAGALQENRESYAAALLADGRVFVHGGYVSTPQGAFRTASAEIYDPTTNAWTLVAPSSTSHASHTATKLNDGRVLITRSPNSGHGDNVAEVYDPATNAWTAAGASLAREGGTATLIDGGRVLVVGGVDYATGLPLPVPPELYHTGSNTFSPAGGLLITEHTATPLSNGTVLIAGGVREGAASARAFVYVPGDNGWAEVASMHTPRRLHAAALQFGAVIVSGGLRPYGAETSAEKYWPGAPPPADPPSPTPTPTDTPTPGPSPTPTPTGFSFQDLDGDGYNGLTDNCPWTYNPGQENTDAGNDVQALPGTDPQGDACDGDNDGDGCGDYDEFRGPPEFGGSRWHADFWDWFDVNDDGAIDLSDTLRILSFFGSGPELLGANRYDRIAPLAQEPWRTAEGNDGIDLGDALVNLQSFGHACL